MFISGLVKISFDIPADFLFQKSENFCSLFEKNASMKNNFDARKVPRKIAPATKKAVLKRVRKIR